MLANLPFSATDAEIRELFAAHGTVESVSIITDRDTGRPRGFGFVEMSRADASRAIQSLNGKELGGRPTAGERGPGAHRRGRRQPRPAHEALVRRPGCQGRSCVPAKASATGLSHYVKSASE